MQTTNAPTESTAAQAPVTAEAIPVMAFPGVEVPPATPPTPKKKRLDWNKVKPLARRALRVVKWTVAIPVIAGILAIVSYYAYTVTMENKLQEVMEQNRALQQQLEDTYSAYQQAKSWAQREQNAPWWQKLGTW